MARATVLRCPAKVNLALSVGAARADGYHPIASWMVAVDFADELELSVDDTMRYDIAFADDAPVKQAVDWPLEKDLAFRAHRLLEKRTGRTLPAHMRLAKRIPAGGGLGGGSADAAGVLVGLNRLYELGVETDELMRLGATLGCDVAFAVSALMGSPSVIATGLGEVLEPAPLAAPIHLVLILPPFGCPTGPVYRAFDASPSPEAVVDEARVRALVAGALDHGKGLFNDLAQPAIVAQPRLGAAMKMLPEVVGRAVHVTGSGSTMFVIATDPTDAEALSRRVREATGMATVVAQTPA